MAWTREQYIDEALGVGDLAQSHVAGTDPATTIKRVLGMVHAREWRGLLNAQPALRTGVRSVATDSDSRIALADLDAGADDAQERLYRVLAVSVGCVVLDESRATDLPFPAAATSTAATDVSGRGTWRREGDYLRLLPLASGTSVTVLVNHTPTPIHELSADTATAAFPRDYELLVCYEAAAHLLARGGKESGAANDLRALADEMRGDLLADVARLGTGTPLLLQAPDRAIDWGG